MKKAASRRAALGIGPVGPELRVEGRLRVVGKVRLAEVHVGEEAPVAVRARARRAATCRNTSPRLPSVRNTSWNSTKPRSKPKSLPGHRVRDEAGGVDALGREQLGQRQAVLRQPRRERDLAVVAVGVLRGPHRRHRAERVDGRRVDALEDDALGGDAVDLGRRRPRSSRRRRTSCAPARVEDDEQDVGPGQTAWRSGSARASSAGRERQRLQRLAAARAQDARAPRSGPRRSAGCPRVAHREPDRARCRRRARGGAPPARPAASRERRSRGSRARARPPAPSTVTRKDAAPGRRAGRGQELGREAQLGRRRAA